jgi:O-antigen ligase
MNFSWVKEKLLSWEKWILYLFIFSIPLQKRLVVFQSDWIFNEWRSFFFYGTDLLLIVLLFFWFLNREKYPIQIARYDYFLFAFLVAAGISAVNAINVDLSIYQTIKLLEFIFLYFYVKSYVLVRFDKVKLLWVVVVGAIFQSLVGIAQFLKQGSIGLGFIGESYLRPDMQGVAVFLTENGDKIMRAYGTTPHPNILSAFLMLSIFALYFLYLHGENLKRKTKQRFFLAYAIIFFAFFLTFSRTTIGVWGLFSAGLGAYYWFNKKVTVDRQRIKEIFLTTIIISLVFGINFYSEILSRLTISTSDEAVSMRIYYNKEAISSGSGSLDLNWAGVGIGNFVTWFMKYRPNLPRYVYQPAHNVFLLIYSEMGILGVGLFVAFLVSLLKKGRSLVLIAFILLMLFDHFPWTLQQGRLMMWLLFALS